MCNRLQTHFFDGWERVMAQRHQTEQKSSLLSVRQLRQGDFNALPSLLFGCRFRKLCTEFLPPLAVVLFDQLQGQSVNVAEVMNDRGMRHSCFFAHPL